MPQPAMLPVTVMLVTVVPLVVDTFSTVDAAACIVEAKPTLHRAALDTFPKAATAADAPPWAVNFQSAPGWSWAET